MDDERYFTQSDYTEEIYLGDQAGDYEEYYEPKQPKKKKKRKKKRYFLKFCIFCLLCAGIYYGLKSDYFNVTAIEVTGNEYYTKAQVIELSGLSPGRNMFELKTSDAKELLLADPYIKIVKIKRIPMGTIRIDITERIEYAAVPYGGQYVLIDEEGMVLRISDQTPTLPLLEGMTLVEMTPGKPLSVEQSYLLTDTLELLSLMDENELYFKRVDFSKVIVKAYIYDMLYCEGAPTNIKDNMEGIEKLLVELYQQNITRGVIKVGKDGYLSFSPAVE